MSTILGLVSFDFIEGVLKDSTGDCVFRVLSVTGDEVLDSFEGGEEDLYEGKTVRGRRVGGGLGGREGLLPLLFL